MTCGEIQKAFSSYLDDQLSLAERAACDTHLQGCPVCRAQMAESRLILRRFAALRRPAAPRVVDLQVKDDGDDDLVLRHDLQHLWAGLASDNLNV
ncbi:MAG: zf-HC2 domain-containing protein [Pyrinomonadaceae bacterium]|nr:zf-HC2 domain-containing protein [Pyrinomonadaceae bacterium]